MNADLRPIHRPEYDVRADLGLSLDDEAFVCSYSDILLNNLHEINRLFAEFRRQAEER